MLDELKFCIECRYYASGDKCFRNSERNLVDGSITSDIDCADERYSTHRNSCGKNARFFEQRPEYLCKDCGKMFLRKNVEHCLEAFKVYRDGGCDPKYADFTCETLRLPGSQCGPTAKEFKHK